MKIAVASQNRRTVTGHAGRCRRFWIFDTDGDDLLQRELIELDKSTTLHELAPAIPAPLQLVEVLIAAEMCANLVTRLQRNGIVGHTSSCSEPEAAVRDYLAELAPAAL